MGLRVGTGSFRGTPASSASGPTSTEKVVSALRTSPLDRWHREHGAKMVAFGGWEMPLRFGAGTLAEHLACRRSAAVFDVSHLGTVRLEGADALATLQGALTNDLSKIGPGRAQYTHLLDEDGSVLDDMMVWWVADERFDVMPNASNTARVVAAIGGNDVTAERAVFAVQGPASSQVLAVAFPEAAEVGRFKVRQLDWLGPRHAAPEAAEGRDGARRFGSPDEIEGRWPAVPAVVAGTGYTGEDGVEVAVPREAATALWEALLAAGATPAGLGARDTLRLEAGLPLHGHELGPGITPLEAGLSWVVAWDKPSGFRGRAALLDRRRTGVSRRLMGVIGDGRQPFREGYPVYVEHLRSGEPAPSRASVAGEPAPVATDAGEPAPVATDAGEPAPVVTAAGEPSALITSGNFSPVLEKGIGMCFLPTATEPGARVRVRDSLSATVVRLPFVRRAPASQPASQLAGHSSRSPSHSQPTG